MRMNIESLSEYRYSVRGQRKGKCQLLIYVPQIRIMAKRVNLISNLSNLRREQRLEALYPSGTCSQIISVPEERLSTFHINLKTCLSRPSSATEKVWKWLPISLTGISIRPILTFKSNNLFMIALNLEFLK